MLQIFDASPGTIPSQRLKRQAADVRLFLFLAVFVALPVTVRSRAQPEPRHKTSRFVLGPKRDAVLFAIRRSRVLGNSGSHFGGCDPARHLCVSHERSTSNILIPL